MTVIKIIVITNMKGKNVYINAKETFYESKQVLKGWTVGYYLA